MDFKDIAAVKAAMDSLPGPDTAAGAAVGARQGRLTKPAGALGRLESLTAWLATWQRRSTPRVDRVRVAVFAGNHGVAAQKVSAFPASVTEQMVGNFEQGGAAINQLCDAYDLALQVTALDLDQPTGDITRGPAMTEAELLASLQIGATALAPDGEGRRPDLLCLGEMGIANTTAAAALAAALFQSDDPRRWVGRGTGIDDEQLVHKAEIVLRALTVNRHRLSDPWAILATLGGRELAAITGAVLAARLASVPVVLDGYATTAAASVLHCAKPGALDHCLVSHQSAEPGHAHLNTLIGQRPLLALDLRLGEASGAALTIPILRGAVACLTGMASFDEAGVDEKS